ncbi:MAG: hypothetical protein WCK31_00895 [bacterium]
MSINIQIGPAEAGILIFTFIALVGLVIFLLVKLNRKIEEVGRPKFGFLGKSLTYTVAAVMLGIGSVIFVGYNLGRINSNDTRTNANNSYKIDFQSFDLESSDKTKAKIALSGVVLEDSIVWGNNLYDLTWSISNSNSTIPPIVEKTRGKDSPSYITVDLNKEIYEITVKAQNGTTVISKTKEIDLRYK